MEGRGAAERMQEVAPDLNGTLVENDIDDEEQQQQQQPENAAKDDEVHHHGSRGKLFIGRLTCDTSAEDLQSHFEKFGDINNAVVKRYSSTGYSRGFGFVTFADPAVCDKVLLDKHVINGRTVEVKTSVSRENMATITGPNTKRIFVGGIPPSITDEDLKNYFAGFGTVVEYRIMHDHYTGRSRGFGFVTFGSEQVVEEILVSGKMYELGGKQVEIQKAKPSPAIQNSPGRGYPGGSGASAGGGYGGYYVGAGCAGYGGPGYGGGYGAGGGYGGGAYGGGPGVGASGAAGVGGYEGSQGSAPSPYAPIIRGQYLPPQPYGHGSMGCGGYSGTEGYVAGYSPSPWHGSSTGTVWNGTTWYGYSGSGGGSSSH